MNYHYDSLLDEDPDVKERVARGQLQMAQKMVIDVLEARFPSLAELGQERVTHIRSTDKLSMLAKQIATAPDETTTRWLLNTLAA